MIAGDDCGCEERKRKLNEKFPRLANIRMTDRHKHIYESVVVPAKQAGRIDRIANIAVKEMYRELGLGKLRITACPSCAKKVLNQLEKIYEASCEES